MKRSFERHLRQLNRTGMVLVLVLVVVMMLSFAVYSFSSQMVTEYTAVTTGLTHLQRRELANSGIELAAILVREHSQLQRGSTESVLFRSPLPVSLPNKQQAFVSLIRELPPAGQSAVFGLNDESAKLNLNSLPLELSRRREARERLMMIPGLTIQTADAILDWMDPDDEVSEFGAESSYYTSLTPPRRPGQRRFRDLRELLQVRGITTTQLYGKDANRRSPPDSVDNRFGGSRFGDSRFLESVSTNSGDAHLKRGWSEWLTVLSGESTMMADGGQKINLNQPILATLYDQLEPVLGSEVATYVVAFRMRGATWLDDLKPDEGADMERRRLERLESVRRRLAAQLGTAEDTQASLTAEQTHRGGLTLSMGSMEFRSLLDLFGGQVQISVDGKDTLLQSPWAADPVTIRRMLPQFERVLTCTDAEFFPGRININEASEFVLQTVPGISDSLARTIVRTQDEIRLAPGGDEFSSVAWLASRSLVSAAELRSLGPYMTTHGDVQSGIAVGQTGDDLPVAMVRFMIRCSGPYFRILSLQDLPVVSRETAGLSTERFTTVSAAGTR